MNHLKQQRGLTLVELLAVLVLISIVSAILFNILITGQKTTTATLSQTAKIDDMRLALRIIGKDVRSASTIGTNGDELILSVGGSEVSYKVDDGVLMQNSTPIVYNVADMDLDPTTSYIVVNLTATDVESLSAKYYLRKGVTWRD